MCVGGSEVGEAKVSVGRRQWERDAKDNDDGGTSLVRCWWLCVCLVAAPRDS